MVIFWSDLSPTTTPSHVPWRRCSSAAVPFGARGLASAPSATRMRERTRATRMRRFRNGFMAHSVKQCCRRLSRNGEKSVNCSFTHGTRSCASPALRKKRGTRSAERGTSVAVACGRSPRFSAFLSCASPALRTIEVHLHWSQRYQLQLGNEDKRVTCCDCCHLIVSTDVVLARCGKAMKRIATAQKAAKHLDSDCGCRVPEKWKGCKPPAW